MFAMLARFVLATLTAFAGSSSLVLAQAGLETATETPPIHYTVPQLRPMEGETLYGVLVRYGFDGTLAGQIGAPTSSDALSQRDKIFVVLWPRPNHSPIERLTIIEGLPTEMELFATRDRIKFEILLTEQGLYVRIDRPR